MKGEKTLVKGELIIREQKVMIWRKISESNVCAYQELAPCSWTGRLRSESTLMGVNYVQISAGKFPFSQLCHIPAKFPLSRTKKDMFENILASLNLSQSIQFPPYIFGQFLCLFLQKLASYRESVNINEYQWIKSNLIYDNVSNASVLVMLFWLECR